MSFFQMLRSVAAGALVVGLVGSAAAQSPAEARLNKKELKALLATASTPADHEKLARHFDAKAAALEEDAAEHDELAASSRTPPPSPKGVPAVSWAQHCKHIATSLHKAAAEARELAGLHKKMAQQAVKPGS